MQPRATDDPKPAQAVAPQPTVDYVPATRSVVPAEATKDHLSTLGVPSDRSDTDAATDLPSVPGYEILAVLGRGGMGVVYKARQRGLNRLVALKMIRAGVHAGAEQVARFRAEAEAVAQLQHAHIVQIHEIGVAGECPFFSLEYVEGGSLARQFNGTPQESRHAAELVQTLALAVQAAHERGIVHRDLKPANVLLTVDGRPKVADFGLAKQLENESDQTQSGSILGTPSYMAPEQASGQAHTVGPAADVYALGVILYEALTGRPPFRGASALDTLEQVRTQEPVSPVSLQPKTPRDLDTICLKCLQKEPHRRYTGAAELAEDLRRFLANEPILARPVSVPERLWRWCRRNRALAWSLGFGIAALVGGLVASSYLAVSESLAAKEAKRSADIADEQSQLALKTLETVIFDIQNKLADIPNAQTVRGDLLKTALTGLKDLSEKLRARERADRGTAMATLHLAEVFRQVGHESGFKGAAAANPLFEHAVEMFEKLLSSSEDTTVAQRDLANAYLLSANNLSDSDLSGIGVSVANVAAQKERPLLIKARSRFKKTIELRRQLREAAPDDADARYELARALAEAAYVEVRAGDQQGTLAWLQEAHELLVPLREAEPTSKRYRAMYGKAVERLGDWYFDVKADLNQAESHYRDALEVTKQLAAEAPHDHNAQFALATSWERMGDLHDARGNRKAALDAFDQELAVTVKLEQAAPNNVQTQWDASISYDHVTRVQMALKRYDEALKHLQHVFDMRVPLLAADPANRRGHLSLLLCAGRLGEVHERRGEFAQAHEVYETTLRRLNAYTTTTNDRSLDADITSMRAGLTRCREKSKAK